MLLVNSNKKNWDYHTKMLQLGNTQIEYINNIFSYNKIFFGYRYYNKAIYCNKEKIDSMDIINREIIDKKIINILKKFERVKNRVI